MRRYRDFLAQEYLPRARATIGVSSNPYGEECYRASIRATTGLELSADSIHRLGLATVAGLEDAMRRIAERSFGASDGATLLQRLRSDPGSPFRPREGVIAPAAAAPGPGGGGVPRWVRTLPETPGVGRVRRAARRRDGVVLIGHGATRRDRRHHAVRGAARRRHRDQRVRLDARAGHRLHPQPHAGAAAPGGGARGPLSGVAGAGAGVRAGAAPDPAARGRGRKRAGREVRHSHVPRSGAGRRRGAPPLVAREDRAMDRGCAVALLLAAAVPAAAQRQPVLKQVDVPHAYYWREMYVPQVTSRPSAAALSPDGHELIYAMQGSLWRPRLV